MAKAEQERKAGRQKLANEAVGTGPPAPVERLTEMTDVPLGLRPRQAHRAVIEWSSTSSAEGT